MTLQVNQAIPTITWTTPAAITYGTGLGATQLNAKATFDNTAVAGRFAYTPAKGTVLGAGPQTLSVVFTPANTADYTPASALQALQVNVAMPKIIWAKPAAIPYGTPLSSKQLNATAPISGSFAYSPAAGTLLAAGTHTLLVTFTPTDMTDYHAPTITATISVNKAVSKTAITSTATGPSRAGQAVTVNFSVTGLGVPTGSVTVKASSGESCTGSLTAAVGSCSLTFAKSGTWTLTASFAGDTNFMNSFSAPVTQAVQP